MSKITADDVMDWSTIALSGVASIVSLAMVVFLIYLAATQNMFWLFGEAICVPLTTLGIAVTFQR